MKIALVIEYDGSNYHGFQKQFRTNLKTIQSVLETALSQIANESITVIGSGRTDTGVHALGQVVHFKTNAKRFVEAWCRGGNSFLPNDIVIQWAKEVDESFHARFSAQSRFYRYVISTKQSSLLRNQVLYYPQSLDVSAMHAAAQHLLGEKDFSSFRAASCQAKSPIRQIKTIRVFRKGCFIITDIIADAFLHHMVRNIIGVLLEIGIHKKKPEWCFEVLCEKDRNAAALTAPADGLYLMFIEYPEKYGFPSMDFAYNFYLDLYK